jgi:hypothetical protein
VRFRSRRHGRSGAGASDQSHDGPTYALVEEARVRCQRLAEAASTSSERASLELVQLELGHAGFIVGSKLPADARQTLLGSAREQATQPGPHESDATRALVATALHAEQAVERRLADPRLPSHMHFVHAHLLRALELLEQRPAGNRADVPARD